MRGAVKALPMQNDAPFLRAQAEKCRRLARTVVTKDVVATLLEMAAEYDARAEKLEREAGG